ncbi:hypothetical protein [Pseudomonas vlassakiae]|uniref:Uncharacterized protein n=1 Tax=Pseudomonas vlassakiae TaxID=485888 RepID=A0A923GJP9_9PSED|nr:hypothetical protein [Pseudomonas vlassakiae]MBV4542779.1 hypothetical protein [Pseudomonas vlassakiae]
MNNATAFAVAFSFVGSQRWVTHGSDFPIGQSGKSYKGEITFRLAEHAWKCTRQALDFGYNNLQFTTF